MKVQLTVGPTGTDTETWEFVDRHCHACGRSPTWVRTDARTASGQQHVCLACGAVACVTPVRTSAEMAQRLAAIATSVGARPPFPENAGESSMPRPDAGQLTRFARGLGRLVQKLR